MLLDIVFAYKSRTVVRLHKPVIKYVLFCLELYVVIAIQMTVTMFVGVVALQIQYHITECHNFHKLVRVNKEL